MKKLFMTLLALLAFAGANAKAADAWLSMAYTNALGDELPFSIFSKNSWAPDPKARFVKLHLYFDEPVMVQGLSIDTCGSNVQPDLSIFFNFDQWILRTTPALDGEVPDALVPVKEGNLLVLKNFDTAVEVRSLTINFEHNAGFKVCGINLKNPKGETYSVKTPALVKGTVSASSTLAPASAYDANYLFDSRFEYGWASNKQAKNVDLMFNFDEPKKVERIRLWNGYQRSVIHCVSNSRAKQIRITGDNGYDEQVSVKDTLGSQVIVLPKPFEGKNLKFQILDSFPGKSYPDLVISELRFFDGKDWFTLDPSPKLKAIMEENRTKFGKVMLRSLLNDSYKAKMFGAEGTEEASNTVDSTLRLRADGSFYLSGTYEEGSSFFALGNYEVKDTDKANGLKLRLFGLLYETVVYGDCNGCGRDCNKINSAEDGTTQKIFQETVILKPTPSGQVRIENQTNKKIGFDRLIFTKE